MRSSSTAEAGFDLEAAGEQPRHSPQSVPFALAARLVLPRVWACGERIVALDDWLSRIRPIWLRVRRRWRRWWWLGVSWVFVHQLILSQGQ